MHLDWSTLALQTVNVLVLLWLLRASCSAPCMAIIAARQASGRDAAGRGGGDARARRRPRRRTSRGSEQGIAAEARAHPGRGATRRPKRSARRLLAQAQQEATSAARCGAGGHRSASARRCAATWRPKRRRLAVAIAVPPARPPAGGGRRSAALLESLLDAGSRALPRERASARSPIRTTRSAGRHRRTARRRGAAPRGRETLATRARTASGDLHFAADPTLIAGVELRGAARHAAQQLAGRPGARSRRSWAGMTNVELAVA